MNEWKFESPWLPEKANSLNFIFQIAGGHWGFGKGNTGAVGW